MYTYDGDSSVPTDQELLMWGWNTNQITHLRRLTPELQRTVLEEYIRRFMEDDSNSLDF